ncbi:nitroreductase family protein [Micromonospora tarensis]|uniref:Nitroreductase family protein n=1 Tax=Micromonospora tarensis TaxID=2806100 RepID=A0ABS1YNF9_9ACTN|nr:nitroreductase family protein [Micromonospora tarensis]MBM0278959.1 nitroreductase family protein [Micromonospora tarensis]
MLTRSVEPDVRCQPAGNLHPLIAGRWSPRAYDPTYVIEESSLRNMLEAARCTPSNRNSQPWRFRVGRRGDEVFDGLLAALTPGNRLWAASASMLICGSAARCDESGEPLRWASYDLGQAIAYLTVQAMSEGLYVRQMAGFDPAVIRLGRDVPTGFDPWIVVAVGALGDPERLPARWQAEEGAGRVRTELRLLVSEAAVPHHTG